ncbi:hypothetical protein [Azospirillum sp. TSO22-1]|uniref:glycine zipper domain-containing protein n=1 Tax=Azospirillum sp. TSO22-1 TaxID=716789 RepID=UPI000D61935A|nr:hypothetical protein [Azospirillum sp. TSO22-1]PWC40175.1 hypothetical protein TSO221_25715 [Azospirillum sp. TSO22-1]
MLNNRRAIRRTALALAVVMTLSACAAGQNTATMTPAEQRLHQQAQDFNQTLTEGAVAGVVIGALLGAALGGRRGAAIGAGAGLATGLAAGYAVAKQKESFATEEARLDSMAADVKADNAKLQQMTVTARDVLAQDRDRIDQVQREMAAGRMNAAEAKRRLASVDNNVQFLTKTVENLKKKIGDYKEAAMEQRQKHVNTSAMETEIRQLEGQVSNLEMELAQLVTRRQITRIG